MEQIIALLETLAEASGYLRGCLEQGKEAPEGLFDNLLSGVRSVKEQLKERAQLPKLPEAALTADWLDALNGWLYLACWQAENLRMEDPMELKPRCSLDKKFLALLEEIRSLPQDTLFWRIKKAFLAVDPRLQKQNEDYFRRFPLWGTLDKKRGDFGIWENKAESLCRHWRDYCWLYQRLEDYRSRQVLFAILNNWYRFDFDTLQRAREIAWTDYFDPDILTCDENEVLVDLGAFVGDSVANFVNTYGQYRKIYCYEIAQDTFCQLQKNLAKLPNIECRMKGAGRERGQMFISQNPTDASANTLSAQGQIPVEVVAIDEDIPGPVTLIKMDIEGAEQDALLGCARHIREEHPKLALSVYHNNEDIWKIPRMIDEICPGYRFWLRYHGGNLWPTEISLLAVYAPQAER